MPVTEPRLPADETSGGEGTGGAGRGRRRFTVTAIAAGIPVACTGILLMTANNPGQHGHASGNSPAATGASASPPAVSPGSSTGADALSLAELDGTGETPRRGAWPLQGQSCGHSLGYLNLTQQESVTYEFHHAYLHFSATVGFIGESQVAGIRHVGFKVWGVEKDGTRVPLPGGMKTIRSPSQIGNIYEKVSGYTGITLETFPEGTRLIKGQGPLAVWGCPELLVR